MTPAMAAMQAATQQTALQGMEAPQDLPAMRAMMQAMQEMNSETSGVKALARSPDIAQGGPGLQTQGKPDGGGNEELDPQQLQLLQMQAAFLQMANSGAVGPGIGTASAETTVAAPMEAEPKVTAATIAASLPNELMTFGIGPTGPMDMSQSAGGWRQAKGRDGLRVSTMQDRQPIVATQRVYTGIVKSFDLVKKSGFIECDEIRQLMQQDVYVFQDVLARGNAGIADIVCFGMHMSGKGKLQASSPLIRLATHHGFAQTGVFQPAAGDSVSEGGQIDCFEVKRVFGRGVRVPKELAEQFKVGRRAGFNCTVDSEGICRAYAGETVADDYAPSPGNLSQSWTIPGYESQPAAPSEAAPPQSSVPSAFGMPGLGISGGGGATSSSAPPAPFNSGPASGLASMMGGAGGLSSMMGGAAGVMGMDSMAMAAMALSGFGVGGKAGLLGGNLGGLGGGTGGMGLGDLTGGGIAPPLMGAVKPSVQEPPLPSLPATVHALAAMKGGGMAASPSSPGLVSNIPNSIPTISAMSASSPASSPADIAAVVSPEAYSDGLARHMEQLRGMMRVDENLLRAAGMTAPPPVASDTFQSLLGEKRKGEEDAGDGAKRLHSGP